jgi:hypothetical protein
MILWILVLLLLGALAIWYISWRKRAVMVQMSELANFGKLIAFTKLSRDLKSGSSCDDLELHRIAMEQSAKNPASFEKLSADCVNYWFGESLEPVAVDDSNTRRIRADSMRWLERNPTIRDLVVQAVRVLNTIEFASRSASPSREKLYVLEVFGKHVKDSPSLGGFREQVGALMHLVKDR